MPLPTLTLWHRGRHRTTVPQHSVQVYPTQGWRCCCNEGGDPADEATSMINASLHLRRMGYDPIIAEWPITPDPTTEEAPHVGS